MKLREKIQYWFDKQVSGGTMKMIILLVAVITAVVILASAILIRADDSKNKFNVVWNNIATVVNSWMPEAEDSEPEPLEEQLQTDNAEQQITPEESLAQERLSLVVKGVVAVVGLLFSGMLIGIFSSAVESKVEDLRTGNTKLLEKGHFVILGFQQGQYKLISELVKAAGKKKLVIVVADRLDRKETDQGIRENIEIPKNVTVITRDIDISDIGALPVCSLNQAEAIIVNRQDDILTLKTLLAVSKVLQEAQAEHVKVIADFEKKGIALPAEAITGRNLLLQTRSTMTRMIARCCTQPGLAKVYEDIFDFDGCEFYADELPEFVGKKFSELIMELDGGVPVGYIRDGKEVLLPKHGDILQEGDRLIYFAENHGDIRLSLGVIEERQDVELPRPVFASKRKLLIVGYSDSLPVLLRQLPENIHNIGFVPLNEDERERMREDAAAHDIAIEIIDTDINSMEQLAQLMKDVGHIVILDNGETEDDDEADMKNTLIILNLRKIRDLCGYDFNITAVLRRENNRKLVDESGSVDFVVASEMSSMIMSQVAVNYDMRNVIRELTSSGGRNLVSCQAAFYGCDGKEHSVRELRKWVYDKNAIMLGYVKRENGHAETVIDPPLSQKASLGGKDSIIVIA